MIIRKPLRKQEKAELVTFVSPSNPCLCLSRADLETGSRRLWQSVIVPERLR